MSQKKFIEALLDSIIANARLSLFLITLFGLILRLVLFSGMGASDDLGYSEYAYRIGQGIDPDSTLTLSTRLGTVYSTYFSYKLFGVNDFSSIFFVLEMSIANIVLAFYFGKLLFNEKIGLLTAFLLSFFPLEVVYATKLYSDLPSAFFMSIGVYFFLYSEMKSRLKCNAGYLLSGLFIGIAYTFKESALLIALFFLLYILYNKKIKIEYFLVPLGVLVVIFAESLAFLGLTGDPLFRFHVSQEYLAESTIAHDYFGRLDFPQGLLHYPYVILTDNLISVYYILIFIAILYFLINKKKETFYPVFWFIALLLYLSFGSANLTQYIPFKATARYLEIITIPGILLLSCFIAEKYSSKKRLTAILLAFLLISSVAFASLREDRNQLGDLRQAYESIKYADKAVYTDSRSVKALAYIDKFENKVKAMEYPDDFSAVKDSYVIVNKKMIKSLKAANKNRIFQKEIENAPEGWVKINQIGAEDDDKITIYYVH